MRVLSIETSTDICSVGVIEDGVLTHINTVDRARSHGEVLAPMISQAIGELRAMEPHMRLLDGVAVSSGPGSYTGLRIGVSSAKAVALAWSIPLLAAPTLECVAMAYAAEAAPTPGTRILCTMRARADEWYVAAYERSEGGERDWIEVKPATIVSGDIVAGDIVAGDIVAGDIVAGEGLRGLGHKEGVHAVVSARDVPLDARFAGLIGEQRLGNGLIEDLNTFEPAYLRDFVARKPKQSIFDRLRF